MTGLNKSARSEPDTEASNAATSDAASIDTVRHFSRFYTRQLGLLDEGLLASDFSLSESRILFELAQRKGMTASDFVRELGMDAGYVSRILKTLRQRGLVTARPAPVIPPRPRAAAQEGPAPTDPGG